MIAMGAHATYALHVARPSERRFKGAIRLDAIVFGCTEVGIAIDTVKRVDKLIGRVQVLLYLSQLASPWSSPPLASWARAGEKLLLLPRSAIRKLMEQALDALDEANRRKRR